LLIGAVYIPPKSDINVYNSHTDTVNNLLTEYCNCKIIILGDYNLPGLHWSVVNNKIVPDSRKFSNLETNILANLSYLNLQQFNVTKNRKNSILDLILSNSPNILVSHVADTLLPIDHLYHPALIITFPINTNYQSLYYNELVYDFSFCNYNIIKSQIASLDWPVLFKNECVRML